MNIEKTTEKLEESGLKKRKIRAFDKKLETE